MKQLVVKYRFYRVIRLTKNAIPALDQLVPNSYVNTTIAGIEAAEMRSILVVLK